MGGLGAREGIPVTHTWEPPPPPPPRIVAAASTGAKLIIALLLLLPLFLFRPNRTLAAWWIWLPIAIAVAVAITMLYPIILRAAGPVMKADARTVIMLEASGRAALFREMRTLWSTSS